MLSVMGVRSALWKYAECNVNMLSVGNVLCALEVCLCNRETLSAVNTWKNGWFLNRTIFFLKKVPTNFDDFSSNTFYKACPTYCTHPKCCSLSFGKFAIFKVMSEGHGLFWSKGLDIILLSCNLAHAIFIIFLFSSSIMDGGVLMHAHILELNM